MAHFDSFTVFVPKNKLELINVDHNFVKPTYHLAGYLYPIIYSDYISPFYSSIPLVLVIYLILFGFSPYFDASKP